MSHLRLGGRQLSVAVGDDENCVEKSGETAWAALRAAHASIPLEPLGSVLVRLYNEARTHFQSKL